MSESPVLFRISTTQLGVFTLSMPIFATIFCVIWSLVFNFEASTATHCEVPNYLPSISASIAGFTPQRYVWRICIALHSFPRFLAAAAYHNYYALSNAGRRDAGINRLSKGVFILHIIENLALLVLSYVSSLENKPVHENSFIVFMLTSQLYMVLTCVLFKRVTEYGGKKMTAQERGSWHYKLYSYLFNLTCCLISVFLYLHHNWYCQPFAYTRYVFFEYLVVFSNIFFHWTAMGDFSNYCLSFISTDLMPSRNGDLKRTKSS